MGKTKSKTSSVASRFILESNLGTEKASHLGFATAAMSTDATNKGSVTRSLSGLSLDTSKSAVPSSKSKSKKVVADSWEDDDDEAADEPEPGTLGAIPSAPPPTPISPSYHVNPPHSLPSVAETSRSSPSAAAAESPGRRPEKTDAVARRMIAAGLGLKAPKQTEEQKEYQKAIREQEKKRREQEKAEEQRRIDEAAKAKAAIWDD